MIEGLRRDAAAVSRRRQLADEATQVPIEGFDPTNTVRVTLSDDGRPSAIRVADNWWDVFTASELGPAVVRAHSVALVERGHRWQEAYDAADDPAVDATPLPTELDVPDPVRSAVAAMSQREIVETTLRRARDAMSQHDDDGTPPPTIAGRSGTGGPSVTLGQQGIVSCDVPSSWAEDKDAHQVSEALTAALRQAGMALPPAPAPAEPDPSASFALANQMRLRDEAVAEGARR